ncbi:MAG: nucleotidyltransferase domain-containing protein [Bacteroidales bacterium]|jgi:predicted nucleotidyltransferase|nr:nucleotidyltransferase domain-containing protein [Bacteroidales bacterium]
MSMLDKNIPEIISLCSKHKVSKLFVFGSILTKNFNKNSDIDFLVDFDGVDVYDYADNYFNFKSSLEILFKRQIDLVENKAIKNPFLRKSIDSSKQLIYG